MTPTRVLVLAKRSALARHVEDERDPRARRLLEQGARVVANWKSSHAEHMRTLERVQRVLEREGARVVLLQGAYSGFETRNVALVVTVGGDGTLLRASHSVSKAPILAINSAPSTSVGYFCAARPSNIDRLLPKALAGELPVVELARMAVSINGELLSKRVLNEALYAHKTPAATSRYILTCGRTSEEQRSSGIWIGPAAGSTAAIRSAGGRTLPLASRKLQLVVREPYSHGGTRYELRKALIEPGRKISILSKMYGAAVFLDGPFRRLPIELGDEACFEVSDEPIRLLGLTSRRKS